MASTAFMIPVSHDTLKGAKRFLASALQFLAPCPGPGRLSGLLHDHSRSFHRTMRIIRQFRKYHSKFFAGGKSGNIEPSPRSVFLLNGASPSGRQSIRLETEEPLHPVGGVRVWARSAGDIVPIRYGPFLGTHVLDSFPSPFTLHA